MYSGKRVHVKMRVKTAAINAVIEWFGNNIDIVPENGDCCLVLLWADENAMLYWGLQYGKLVEILEPKELRSKEKDALCEIQKKYNVLNP
jgi:predicted DNA-binding transcriptional regulator YafY